MVKQLQFKLVLLLCALVAGVSSAWADDVTDVLSNNDFAATGTSYMNFSNVQKHTAIYAGRTSVQNNSIGMKRDNTNGGGIFTTASGGVAKSLSFTWTSTTDRTLEVYGKHSAYSLNDTKNNSNYGERIASITYDSNNTSPTLTLNSADNYEYILIIPSSTSMLSINDISITWDTSGSSNLTTSDLALTNAPIVLSFDLYNNSAAQTINYTTSSTGVVTVSASDYVTTSVDATNKTITVTPKTSVTPSAQTITISQEADDTYEAGSVTFTVNITDSTPFEGGDVTFDATKDVGTNSSGSGAITKKVVTVSCTSSYLSDGVAYRLYSGSTTTISTTLGKITGIAFTMADNYANTLLSTTTGTYSNGIWTGKEISVAFSASAQARVTKIVVTVENKQDIATVNSITPTSVNVSADGSFTYDITYADGVSASDATISWTSDDDDVLTNVDGDYLAGSAEGTANVTVTVTPKDANSNYAAVSATFAVNVVDSRTPIATINSITPTSIEVGATGSFTYDIDFAEGTGASDYEINYGSGNNNVLAVSSDGSYLAGDNAGEVEVTVTVVPLDDTTYKSVSKKFTVTIVDPNAKGTINNPFTVADVKGQASATSFGTDIYVMGYIVGCVKNNKCYKTTTDNLVDSNLLLADTPDISFTEGSNVTAPNNGMIPIELKNNISTNWGPSSNYVFGHKVLIKGDAQSYFGIKGIKNTDEIAAVSVIASVSSAGLATFACNAALDFTNVDGLEAYIATGTSSIALQKVNKVPADQGILLRATDGGDKDYTVPVTTGDLDNVTGNLFVRGTGAAVVYEPDGGGYNYVLSIVDDELGFYKAAGNTVSKNRAYLHTTTSAARIAINFNDESAGIAEIEGMRNVENEKIYNLNGQRVSKATKGLYIVNGKKVIRN